MFRTILAITFFGFILGGCASSKRLFGDQDPVPADFGKEPTTVLVIRSEQNKVNKALENAFQKYYTGPFELIDQKDLTTNKYSDTKKYRYCFRTKIQFKAASGMGNTRMPATNNYSYDVLDRVTAKVNSLDYYGGAYKGLMEAYVKKLEETRTANSK